MNWPTATSDLSEFAEDVAPGVARVRPAVFPSLPSKIEATSALRAYQPASAQTRPGMAAETTALAAARRALLELPFGASKRSEETPARPRRSTATRAAPQAEATPAPDLEQRLAPLRGISRELTARGMPSSLVSELLAEIIAEFGNQVLESERSARLALVEQLLLRIPVTPIAAPDVAPRGVYLITGASGSGKSVFIAHLALHAARMGHDEVVLVNTESARIGAAAQMNALGAVFGYDVEHVYTPQELRQLTSRHGRDALIVVETAGWSPRDGAGEQRKPWKWQLPKAHVVVCIPATSQADDINAILSETRENSASMVAALSKTGETRNVLPALSALALARQPVGMVVPGPDLTACNGSLDLGDIARDALGVVLPQRKRGRVRC